MIENYLNNIINNTEQEELSIDEKINLITNYTNNENILLKNISDIFNLQNTYNISQKINFNNNVLKDLNIFDDENPVFNNINNTTTLYGTHILKYWLSNPTKDLKLLKNRQNNIKQIINDKLLYIDLYKNFNNIKNTENKILWFWNDLTDEIKSLYNMVYFDVPFINDILNNNSLILNIINIYKIFLTPTFSIFIPIISFILPYILLVIFNKKISFGNFIKFLFKTLSSTPSLFNILPPQYSSKAKYFSIFLGGIYTLLYIQSGYYSVRNAMDTNKIIEILYNKIQIVFNVIKNTVNIKSLLDNTDIKINDDIDEDIEYFKKLFDTNIFDNNYKLFNNKGNILSIYYNFINNKEKLISILKYLGEIDIYLSLSNLYNKFTNNKLIDNKYCFAKYTTKNKPYLKVKDIWHPNLQENPITNSITLGKKNKNLLITGPNKSGKSIFIKSLATSIILSQTIGIVPSSKFVITPFQILNSYLHIPDITGKASLFEAEMNRAKEHIKNLNNIKHNDFAFIIMDEIFTSTNYVEGYSAAYSICKKLSNYKNSISIITTHFTGLHKIENKTNKNITNYKFLINRDKDNNIIYEHKLKKGYSKQYIALELLKNNNFDNDIISDAINICNKLKKKY